MIRLNLIQSKLPYSYLGWMIGWWI